MDLLKFSADKYERLEGRLAEIDGSMLSPFQKFSDTLYEITVNINELRKKVSEVIFSDDLQEITFFKIDFPRFYSLLIYASEKYNILSAIPAGTDQMARDYYLQELTVIKRSFNHNQFAYQYFLNSETVLDENYFLRRNFTPYHPGLPLLIIDEITETNMGYQFAKFRAYEMLQSFIIKKIQSLYQKPDNTVLNELLIGNNRRWTGEKINLIEIAYGIYYTGQMNDGKAELKDVINWLETSLNVDLTQAYRMFLDIRRRKTTSYTKYLEKMSQIIQLHIEESFDYKPKSKK
jgi:hypothetical protein